MDTSPPTVPPASRFPAQASAVPHRPFSWQVINGLDFGIATLLISLLWENWHKTKYTSINGTIRVLPYVCISATRPPSRIRVTPACSPFGQAAPPAPEAPTEPVYRLWSFASGLGFMCLSRHHGFPLSPIGRLLLLPALLSIPGPASWSVCTCAFCHLVATLPPECMPSETEKQGAFYSRAFEVVVGVSGTSWDLWHQGLSSVFGPRVSLPTPGLALTQLPSPRHSRAVSDTTSRCV